jgi:hypothetical protein
LRQREEVQEVLRFPRRGEVGVTEETAAFAHALIFDGVSAELREGCVRVTAGTIVEVGEEPEPGGARIGPGAVADLLVLDGDPLRDPSVLWGARNGGPCTRAASGWRSIAHGWCC